MRTEAQKRAGRAYYERNMDLVKSKSAADYAENREAKRESHRKAQLKSKHGLTVEEFNELWKAQDGLCYLCEKPLDINAYAIDHNHRCCPPGKSCDECRRGIAHKVCNTVIGLTGDNPDLLMKIASNLKTADLFLERM